MAHDNARSLPQEVPQDEREEPFAARRLEGRGAGWSHVGGAILTFCLWQLSVVPLILGVALLGYPGALEMIRNRVNWVDLLPDQDAAAIAACAILLLSLIVLLLINWLIVRVWHRRSLMSILTAHERFRWRSALMSFAIFAGAILLVSSTAAFLNAGAEVQVIFDSKRFFPFLVLVLVLTPFQCLAEEAFVRGYLYQGVAAFTASNILRIGVPAAVFMAMHSANGDFLEGGIWVLLIYFTFGTYFGLLTVKTAGVEVAAGAHTANNIFAFAISTSAGAGMPFATIFYEPEPDYMAGFVMILLVAALHYLIFFRLFRNRIFS